MNPKEAGRKENENKVWRNLYPEFGGKTMTPKFAIGNNVRKMDSNMDGRGFYHF